MPRNAVVEGLVRRNQGVGRPVPGEELEAKTNDGVSLAVEHRTGFRRVIAAQSAHCGSETITTDRRE